MSNRVVEGSWYKKPRRRKVVKRMRIASRGGYYYTLSLECGHTAFRSESDRGHVVRIVECRDCTWIAA